MPKDKMNDQVTLELGPELAVAIDNLKDQFGLRTRSEVAERVLNEVFFGEQDK